MIQADWWAGRDNRTFCIHLKTIRTLRGGWFYPNIMSTSKDMTAPANAMGSTSKRADGVAASISTVDVELVCVKDERSSNRSRNSCASTGGLGGQKEMFLGKEIVVDARTEYRLKWAHRGIGTFSFFGVLCYIVSASISNNVFGIIAIVYFCLGYLCIVMLLYKNISFVMMKRLFKEPNVIIIMVLSVCNWAIEIGQPYNSLSPLYGFMYMLIVNWFVLMDAVTLKSRYLIMGIGVVFVAVNVYNLYGRIFGDIDNGVVLVKYNIQGKEYTIMKRSTQRLIFLQVLLFSANGIYTTFVDKTMKLMMFATGNIYKSTGTASEEVEAGSFAYNLKQENHKKIEEYRQSRRGVIKK